MSAAHCNRVTSLTAEDFAIWCRVMARWALRGRVCALAKAEECDHRDAQLMLDAQLEKGVVYILRDECRRRIRVRGGVCLGDLLVESLRR